MKHEYLIELLKQNKTVILPNIGAFSNTDNAKQPFLFNEFLKFNDGMVAKHISSKEGISMDAAGENVEKFTNELKEILAAGKEVVIPGIGTLHKKDGKTILSHGVVSAVTPTTETKQEPIAEKKPEPIIEKKPDPIVEKKPEPIIEKKPDPIIEKKPEPIIEKKQEPIIEKKAEPIIEKVIPPISEKKNEPVPEKKIEPVMDKKTETIAPVAPENPKTKKEKQKKDPSTKKKKSRKLIWIILLLLILGGGGTAGYFYKDQLMKLVGMDKSETTADNKEGKENKETKDEKEEPIIESDTTATVSDSTSTETVEEVPLQDVKEEVIKEEPKAELPRIVETGKSGTYYVIVGCFSMEPHANNMMEKVTEAGFTPINVGTFGSLIHIAAGSGPDLNSALQEYEKIKSSFPKAWIMGR
jgi:nucleoid DNA-binding protein